MSKEFSRQSFLGSKSQAVFEQTTIGIVGLGGGGSHIAQQLAHLGFSNYVIVDPDTVESHNLNRLVGGAAANIGERKIETAARLITGVRPRATVRALPCHWQDGAEALRRCSVICGALDGFRQRRDLESFTRRYMIPLIDIGMDVAVVEPEPPQMNGQVILSMPGCACMTCMGFLNEERLAKEAAKYGDAGINPQVVWANGILASLAVGMIVDLLTDWTKSLRTPQYLLFRGNVPQVTIHPRVPFIKMGECPHFPIREIGPPRLKAI